MSRYFSQHTFGFLRGLARNNEREWFHAHKPDYETHVREPFLRLLTDLQPDLAAISPHFRSDPKLVGGSLFRIHRDTRFSHNKAPYKGWQSARLFHERFRQVPAPSWYLHVEPGECFVAAGIWHPEPPALRQIRQFIVDNPASWKNAAHSAAFKRRFHLSETEMLTRPPRGFPADFEYSDDLRRKNFIAIRMLDPEVVTGPRLRQTLARDLQGTAPLMDYLCAALDLEF